VVVNVEDKCEGQTLIYRTGSDQVLVQVGFRVRFTVHSSFFKSPCTALSNQNAVTSNGLWMSKPPFPVVHTHEGRSLGVIFDSDMNFEKHFSNRTCQIRSFLSFSYVQTLVLTFVSTHMDHCDSLITRLPQKSINRFQLTQNTAARVLTRTRKYDHISLILASVQL